MRSTLSQSLKNTRVLISGASIAGPALAFWLQRYGFSVTIVEHTPTLRVGGYKIDLRGKAIDVVKKMGIYPQIKTANVEMLTAGFINDSSEIIAEMPADFLAMRENDDVELLRADLSRILYDVTHEKCEYIFNDSIRAITQSKHGVEIDFTNGVSRTFDLLIGADGIHSNVRSLVFGHESMFSYPIGNYYFSIYSLENYLHLDRYEFFYSQINKLVNVYGTKNSDTMKALFIFNAPTAALNHQNINTQKNIVREVYADAKWEVPRLLSALNSTPDFYFDEIKQIRMKSWHKNRVVLLGDAAYAPSLGSGQGTSMAIIGAYILAGEIFAAQGNYETAFNQYESEMHSFVKYNHKLGVTIMQQMVPKANSWLQKLIQKIISYLPLQNVVIKRLRNQIRYAANCIKLKDYE